MHLKISPEYYDLLEYRGFWNFVITSFSQQKKASQPNESATCDVIIPLMTSYNGKPTLYFPKMTPCWKQTHQVFSQNFFCQNWHLSTTSKKDWTDTFRPTLKFSLSCSLYIMLFGLHPMEKKKLQFQPFLKQESAGCSTTKYLLVALSYHNLLSLRAMKAHGIF